MGSGLHNMHRGLAMAFGVALSSVLLEQRLTFHQTRLEAYQDCFLVIGIGFVLALFPVWVSRRRVPPTRERLPSPQAAPAQVRVTGHSDGVEPPAPR